MLYTLAEYIVNVQSSTTSDRFLTIFTFAIRTAVGGSLYDEVQHMGNGHMGGLRGQTD